MSGTGNNEKFVRNVVVEKSWNGIEECGISRNKRRIRNWNVELQRTMTGLGIGMWNLSTQKWDWEWNWNTENSMWNCIPIPEYKVDFPL